MNSEISYILNSLNRKSATSSKNLNASYIKVVQWNREASSLSIQFTMPIFRRLSSGQQQQQFIFPFEVTLLINTELTTIPPFGYIEDKFDLYKDVNIMEKLNESWRSATGNITVLRAIRDIEIEISKFDNEIWPIKTLNLRKNATISYLNENLKHISQHCVDLTLILYCSSLEKKTGGNLIQLLPPALYHGKKDRPGLFNLVHQDVCVHLSEVLNKLIQMNVSTSIQSLLKKTLLLHSINGTKSNNDNNAPTNLNQQSLMQQPNIKDNTTLDDDELVVLSWLFGIDCPFYFSETIPEQEEHQSTATSDITAIQSRNSIGKLHIGNKNNNNNNSNTSVKGRKPTYVLDINYTRSSSSEWDIISTRTAVDETAKNINNNNINMKSEENNDTIITAFHGTPGSNILSILLQGGLKVFSGTRQMKNGAIFGDGVYFAQDINVSLNFAKPLRVSNSYQIKTLSKHQILNRNTTNNRNSSNSSGSADELAAITLQIVFKADILAKDNYISRCNTSSGKEGNYYIVSNPKDILLKKVLIFRFCFI